MKMLDSDTYTCDIENVDLIKCRLEHDGFARVKVNLALNEFCDVQAILDRVAFSPSKYIDWAGYRRDLSLPGGGFGQIEVLRALWFERSLKDAPLFRACERLADKVLGGAFYWFDHLIYKMPRNATCTKWHQDEAFANPRDKVDRLHFWIPFQDVNISSGAMAYVPGSHRGNLIAHNVANNGGAVVRSIELCHGEEPVSVPVRRGELLIHLPRTKHAASGNESSELRRAWILHFGSRNRRLVGRVKELMSQSILLSAVLAEHFLAKGESNV